MPIFQKTTTLNITESISPCKFKFSFTLLLASLTDPFHCREYKRFYEWNNNLKGRIVVGGNQCSIYKGAILE
jgi:hypothetical protein